MATQHDSKIRSISPQPAATKEVDPGLRQAYKLVSAAKNKVTDIINEMEKAGIFTSRDKTFLNSLAQDNSTISKKNLRGLF